MEALAGHVLHDVVDRFAFVEAVEERGERAEVQRRGADAKQVGLDAAQLAEDRAQDLAARRDVDAHQLFDRAVPGDLVVDRRRVVHAVDDGDVLVVVQVLAELLKARVQVADVRHAADDALAIQFQHQAQGGVGGGVLRPEVERPAVAGLRLGVEVGRRFDVHVNRFQVVWHGVSFSGRHFEVRTEIVVLMAHLANLGGGR